MFKAVTKAAFSQIQQKLFPIYFGMQTALPVILALTFPGNTLLGLQSGPQGLLHEFVRWNSLVPIASIFVTGLVNLAVLLPATLEVMKERRGQGKIPNL